MEQNSMTALVSVFARAYHDEQNEVKVFSDGVARRLLTDEEYTQIAGHMARGAAFFCPSFEGNEEQTLRRVVDDQLSPSPLGRAAFAEEALEAAVRNGTRQYILLGAGYDTFAYRQPEWARNLSIIEVDHPLTAADKRRRLAAAGIAAPGNLAFLSADFTEPTWICSLSECKAFRREDISFCSILGVSYYLPRRMFLHMLSALDEVLPEGSAVAFDYPDADSYTDQAGERARKQMMLAGAAKENMLAGYAFDEMEGLLRERGWRVVSHLTPNEITARYFDAYNRANPDHCMTAFDNVNYCLAVKE